MSYQTVSIATAIAQIEQGELVLPAALDDSGV